MPYSLPGVKPHVKQAAEDIGKRFSVKTIIGVALRKRDSDHPRGLALDFMVGKDRAKGEAIAGHTQANATAYGVNYIIWWQRIWSHDRAGEGWRVMEDRGNDTENHKDHVHVSFNATGGTGTVQNTASAGGGISCMILVACAGMCSALGYVVTRLLV